MTPKKKPADGQAAEPEPKNDTGLTLRQLAEKWCAHLDRAGKSDATIASYKADLRVALDHFGDDSDAAAITTGEVAKYFESDAVTKLKSGKAKSQISIDKTRRILRLAFDWAVENKLVAASPVPPLERKRKTPAEPKPAAKPKGARKA